MERALSSFTKLGRGKSSKDLLAGAISRDYPTDAEAYTLLEDCGRGVSATVHRAWCVPMQEEVAVKKMNLERVSMTLEEIIREAQTMKSYHHPNVLPLYTSFVAKQDLWMVTPFMSGGSVLHIMKYQYPEGLSETVIATIMKYVLEGLNYVHTHGGIHRDVKAGNILMDQSGRVMIGDFGVAATNDRTASWGKEQMSRTTFVGTPCWMAPEVMEQSDYDTSADIWSFGITMLELANGHAPFAKFPPLKVLLMTLQNPPPQLDDKQGRKHFSKQMRNVVGRCLQKDRHSRPSAKELLEDKFFKQARDEEFLARELMTGLPALGERVQQIRVGKAATTAAENDKQLERSQEEYVKGVSSWNFDLAALRAQAAMEPDDGSVPQTPTLPTIAEGPEPTEGDGSGQSSRRSTDDAAALPVTPPAATQQQLQQQQQPQPPTATQQQQQQQPQQQQSMQQPAEQQQQQQQPQQSAVQQQQQPVVQQLLPQPQQQQPVPAVVQQQQPAQLQATQQPQQPAAVGSAGSKDGTTQLQAQPIGLMRRAASAFAESPSLAAAAAAAGTNITAAAANGSSTLQNHFSEPAAVQNQSAAAGANGSSAAAVQVLGSSGGGSSFCLPPLNGSPPMSREPSSQGPLSMLTTPDGISLRGKSKGRHGRFQVYEHGEEPPPMSPPANRGMQEGLAGSFTRSGGLAEGRVSDSAADTPRQVLAASEAAELAAAAAAATAAACNGNAVVGFAGGDVGAAGIGAAVSGSATPPLPASGLPPPAPIPASVSSASVSTVPSVCSVPSASTVSVSTVPSVGSTGLGVAGMSGGTMSDGVDAAGGVEPKKRGRFKIIEEEAPSSGRAPVSKVPSSADLGKAGRGMGNGVASFVLPELLKLHEQTLAQQAALARLIEGVKVNSSLGNLAAAAGMELEAAAALPAAATAPAGSAAAVAAAAAAGVPVAVSRKLSTTGSLSRSTSNRALVCGDMSRLTVGMLLPLYDNDAGEVAERLLERAQELERQKQELESENNRLRVRLALAAGEAAPGAAGVASGGGSSSTAGVDGSVAAAAAAALRGSGVASELDSSSSSRMGSRRASTATTYIGAGGSSAAGAGSSGSAAGTGGGASAAAGIQQQQQPAGSGGGSSTGSGGGGLGERYSSGGNSGDSNASCIAAAAANTAGPGSSSGQGRSSLSGNEP